MNTDSQIPEGTFRRIGEEYALMCTERPLFIHCLTSWRGEQADRLAESRRRLVCEFDESRETSLEDVVGLEMAEFNVAYGKDDFQEAERRILRSVAAMLYGLRILRFERTEHEALVRASEGTEESNE